MRLMWIVLLLAVSGCKPTAEERRQQVESDLKEIDRLQQDRFRYEAEQQKAVDSMRMREAINKAKANY